VLARAIVIGVSYPALPMPPPPIPLTNDSEWDEVRLGMHALGALRPRWRTRDLDTGYLSAWDGDWYYHFRVGGYRAIEWVEIAVGSEEQRRAVLGVLIRVHVPGEETVGGFRVYGYVEAGAAVTYIADGDPPVSDERGAESTILAGEAHEARGSTGGA
jgi:hypothetical protein